MRMKAVARGKEKGKRRKVKVCVELCCVSFGAMFARRILEGIGWREMMEGPGVGGGEVRCKGRR